MRLTVISYPEMLEGEHAFVTQLLQAGLTTFHVRKPNFTDAQLRDYLSAFDDNILKHFIIHEHHHLIYEFPLRGLHFKAHQKPGEAPQKWIQNDLVLSMSCHSLGAIEQSHPSLTQLLLSPIFKSISKPDYGEAFNQADLRKTLKNFHRPPEILALGGVTAQNLATIKELGFDGAVLHGDVWQTYIERGTEATHHHFRTILEQAKKLNHA